MDYYKEKQFIAQVDKNDNFIGKIEKWEGHKKAILHRAFTMILCYGDKVIVQHRKHPVFDGYFDLSFSSHPLCHPISPLSFPRRRESSDSESPTLSGKTTLSNQFRQINIDLESMEVAIYKSLKREWNLDQSDLIGTPEKIGQIYYKAKDPNSEFSDHEIDYIYEGTLKNLPTPNYDFAYGFSLIDKSRIPASNFPLLTSSLVAPWVKVMLEKKLIK